MSTQVESSRWETSFCGRNSPSQLYHNQLDYFKSWRDLRMLRFMFWFRIQSALGPVIQIYPNQIWSASYWYRNIISTHTNRYVMLGLCVKPCATSSHYFTTLWICEYIVLPLRKHCEEKSFNKVKISRFEWKQFSLLPPLIDPIWWLFEHSS